MKKSTTTLEKNTVKTLRSALDRARALDIRHLVVASTTGRTALLLASLRSTAESVVCVTHHVGFRKPGHSELTQATEARLKKLGISVVRAGHALSGIERDLRMRFGGIGPAETVACTYRTFGEGTKVCVEISTMALDAGLIPYGRDIVAIAGTGTGADTALVIRPAHSRSFFTTQIREIICKPRSW